MHSIFLAPSADGVVRSFIQVGLYLLLPVYLSALNDYHTIKSS